MAFLYLGRRGGGDIYALRMAEIMGGLGMEMGFFLSKEMEHLGEFRKRWSGIHAMDAFGGGLAGFIMAPFNALKIIMEMRRFRPDVIYIPMLSPLVPLVLLYPWKAKKLFTFHGQYFRGGLKDWVIERMQDVIVMQCDSVIALSDHYKRLVEERYGEKAFLVPHPDIGYYGQGKEGDGRTVLFIGRIGEAYKGGDVMVEAFRKARGRVPGLRLVVAGGGSSKYGKVEGIEIVDRWLSDGEFGGLMASADIVCVPYLSPTPSGIVSAAMDMGKAVIASDVPGLNEQVKNGETGLLFKAGDAERLAEKIVELATDAGNRKALGEEAKKESKSLGKMVAGKLEAALNG